MEINPINWLKAAQDLIAKTERSSGFRPYLVFMALVIGASFTFMLLFPNNQFVAYCSMGIFAISTICFVIAFFLKAIMDPDFCRSETHVYKLRRLEMETFGSESKQVSATTLESPQLVAPDSSQTETGGMEEEEK